MSSLLATNDSANDPPTWNWQQTTEDWTSFVREFEDRGRNVSVFRCGYSSDFRLPIDMISVWPNNSRLDEIVDVLLVDGSHEEFIFKRTLKRVCNRLLSDEGWAAFSAGNVRLNIIPELDPDTHILNEGWLSTDPLTLLTFFLHAYRPPGWEQAAWGLPAHFVTKFGRVDVNEPTNDQAAALMKAINEIGPRLRLVVDGHNSLIGTPYWLVNHTEDLILQRALAGFARQMGIKGNSATTEKYANELMRPWIREQITLAQVAQSYAAEGVNVAELQLHGGSLSDYLPIVAPDALHLTCEPPLFPILGPNHRQRKAIARMGWNESQLEFFTRSYAWMLLRPYADVITHAASMRPNRRSRAVLDAMRFRKAAHDAYVLSFEKLVAGGHGNLASQEAVINDVTTQRAFALREFGQAYQLVANRLGKDNPRAEAMFEVLSAETDLFSHGMTTIGQGNSDFSEALQYGTILIGIRHVSGLALDHESSLSVGRPSFLA